MHNDQYTFRLIDFPDRGNAFTDPTAWIQSPQVLQYKALHNALFPGTDVSAMGLDWRFNWINSGKARTYGAFTGDSDELVGIWSVEPKEFRISADDVIEVGRCFAVGIHAHHRRTGLFTILSKFALHSEKEIGQYEYIVGFPQRGRPVLKGHFNAGWYPVQEIDVYEFDMANLPSDFQAPSPDEPVPHTSVGHAEYSQFMFCQHSANKRVPGSFHKWHRWARAPLTHYIPIVFPPKTHNALDDGYIVLKPYRDWVHIVALEGPGEERLLSAAKGLCKNHGWSKLSIWCADNQVNSDEIVAEGFTKTEEAVQIIAYNVNAEKDLKLPVCNIQMGIEEIY